MSPENPVVIDQVSPIGGSLAGGYTVTITGAEFQEGAVSYFADQLAEKTTVKSDTVIEAVVPETKESGTVAVTIVNPDGTQFTLLDGFTYVSMDKTNLAEVAGVSPLTVIEGANTEITLRGRNLIEAYEKGVVALRGPSRADISISDVGQSTDAESGIDILTFNVTVSSSPALGPKERIAIQILASTRPESQDDLIVESSKEMFTVLPQEIPVPIAYTPSLSTDKPTMVVVLGRNLDGCTLEFGNGIQKHLQKSEEDSLFGLVTISKDVKENEIVNQFSVMDKNGNSLEQYNLLVAESSNLKQSDPILPDESIAYEGGVKPKVESPDMAFTIDLAPVEDQLFLGPTAEDSRIFYLNGKVQNHPGYDLSNFSYQVYTYYRRIPIIRRVYLYPMFDGGGEELGSPILAQVGDLFPLRGVGILFAARIEITIVITVIVIVTIEFPWQGNGFNEFPEEYPNAMLTIIWGVNVEIDIIIIIGFLTALVLPNGGLRLLFVFELTINIDFRISTDGRHLNFMPNFTHTVVYSSIFPFAEPLPCGGRFQLAEDNGQNVFTDQFGNQQSFYFVRSAGQCCVSWRFNLELTRFRSGGNPEVVRPAFDASMCIDARPSTNIMNVIITSLPPPQGIPPTLEMNIADSALLKAMAQPVDQNGVPTGPMQDLRDLGYTVKFFLEYPPVLLDPATLPEGNAFAIQPGQNVIHARISFRGSNSQLPYTFWYGAILGFDIIRALAEGENPNAVAGTLPLEVNPNPDAIQVEPVLAYENLQNGQTVLVQAPKKSNTIQPGTDLWEMERYEPFETQRDYFVAVKLNVPQNVTLPVTLNFKLKLPKLQKYIDDNSVMAGGIPYGSFIFGTERYSTDAKNFFTGNMVEGTQSAPVTASITINTRPAPTDLIKLPGIVIKPNVKEEDAVGSAPKKLVLPGKNVIINTQGSSPKGTNSVVTIPMMCEPDSNSNATVSFPKPEFNLVVRNDETFEEFLRVFKQVQPIITGAGNYFRDFAESLYNELISHGNTLDENELKTQGADLWIKSCRLVTPLPPVTTAYLDDRPLYWTRLRAIGAIRAFAYRKGITLSDSLLGKFEFPSRGLDPDDGGLKFTGTIPPGVRKAIITGFDPFGLDYGSNGAPSGNDNLEQSNPSGLLALAFNEGLVDIPNQGSIYVRTAIFPVRFKDFNNNIVENAVTSSLSSITTLITVSENRGLNYYDVERWAGRHRSDGMDNNNKKGTTEPGMPPIIPPGEEYLESTLPFALAITMSESLAGPMGLAGFVIDQSYKTVGVAKIRETRRLTTPTPPFDLEAGKFRPEPLVTDIDGHVVVTDRPTQDSQEGSGSSYLSNEIFYRVALKRKSIRPMLASGHLHVPSTGYYPRGVTVGSNLLSGSREAFKRLLKYGFRFSGSATLDFPSTVINTTAERTLTVTNTTTETLHINSIDISAPFTVGFPSPSPLPITVNPGATAGIPVRFTPTSAGVFSAVMTLRETSGEILFIANLSGTGIQTQPAPVISSFFPQTVQWGDSITVTGQYFTTTTFVKIGNMLVDFSVVSDTEIHIFTDLLAGNLTSDYSIEDENVVPPTTGSITGYIKVTTAFGTATSSSPVRLVFIYPE